MKENLLINSSDLPILGDTGPGPQELIAYEEGRGFFQNFISPGY